MGRPTHFISVDHSNRRWRAVSGGVVKATYDILLLVQFRSVAAVDA